MFFPAEDSSLMEDSSLGEVSSIEEGVSGTEVSMLEISSLLKASLFSSSGLESSSEEEGRTGWAQALNARKEAPKKKIFFECFTPSFYKEKPKEEGIYGRLKNPLSDIHNSLVNRANIHLWP